MSNNIDRTTVELFVNGEQAEQAMERLQKRADELSLAIDAAVAAGNKKEENKLRKQLRQIEKEMNRTESAAKGIGIVLNDLSNSSLHGLKNTLRFLQKEISMTKPNTEQWQEYAEQIQAVKDRIVELNEEMEGGQTLWEKFKTWAVGAWSGIDLIVNGYKEAVCVISEFVDEYATMDQEMANVRKFTGMTEAKVKELNEAFKGINTRTWREELNKLAQEAGRLGKTSIEDVLGFVNAADKINVALDDLGDGATLTLSKLTGIFGDEDKYGTEQSLLKVGSVINELSQNCAASAPYLADFASRMGGVGAQANMTIPQIMAFGAVLDSNEQAVEASATALSQVIVRMMQEPAKYAKVAGLDVKKFSDMLKTDVNGALILFLETLQKAGGMDTLSPMFKDMGENGSRAISALSTLATNIEDVKAQQIEANKAFREGISIDNEFEVQNTTLQASLEKAQKRFQELRIELGEKLSPLMAHIISSTSAMAKSISVIVDFCVEHKTALILLTTAIGSYYAAVSAATFGQKAWNVAVLLGKNAVAAFKYTVGLLQVGMIALTKGTRAAGTAFTFLNMEMKANPFGLVISLLATLAVVIAKLVSKTEDLNSKMRDSVNISFKYNEQMEKELTELDKMVGALEGAKEGTEEYDKAKTALLNKYGSYLQGLVTEEGKIIDLEVAYKRLAEAIRIANEERGIAEARKAVDDTYFEEMGALQTQLMKSLQEYGADSREAARLAMEVSTAMSANREIDGKTVARINELSMNTPKYSPNGSLIGNIITSVAPGIRNSSVGEFLTFDQVPQPAAVINSMYNAKDVRKNALNEVDIIQRNRRPYGELADGILESMIDYAQSAVDEGGGTVLKITDALAGTAEFVEVTAKEAQQLLDGLQGEFAYRKGGSVSNDNDNPIVPTVQPGGGYVSQAALKEQEKERKKREAEARRQAAKEKKEFKATLDGYKAEKMEADRVVLEEYRAGTIDYETMIRRRHENEDEYYEKSLTHFESVFADQKDTYLQDDKDYQKLLLDKEKADQKYEETRISFALQRIERTKSAEEKAAQHDYDTKADPTFEDEIALQAQLYAIRKKALDDKLALYTAGSKEYADISCQITELENKKKMTQEKLYFEAVKSLREKYDEKGATERFKMEKATLDALLEVNAITSEEYDEYLKKIRAEYAKDLPGDKSEDGKKEEKYKEQKAALQKALDSELLTTAEFYQRILTILIPFRNYCNDYSVTNPGTLVK